MACGRGGRSAKRRSCPRHSPPQLREEAVEHEGREMEEKGTNTAHLVLCCGGPVIHFGCGAVWSLFFLNMVQKCIFTREESGMQWEDYLFELQNAVEWRMLMSRGPDERAQMRSMSDLLSTCDGMSNRELIDDGATWIQQGNEQEQRDRTAGVKSSLQCAGERLP